jgi:fatty acid desaturase
MTATESPIAQKSRSYARSASPLRRELGNVLPQDVLKRLHQRRPWLHFGVVLRQFLLLFASGWVAFSFSQPWIWIPAAILEGFVIFNFTVLLHEQVHEAIFPGRHPRLLGFLGLLYAVPSGISASQFHRWHMDHHENLGSATEDPKRAHLSPKRNARWYKLLYMTPALIPIYFSAARRENLSYSPELRRRIAGERTLTIVVHLVVFAALFWIGGLTPVVRAYLIPYLLVFPVAFTLNRLGQHYRIDPTDPRKWSTRVDGNPIWHFLFLWSNFHLEHHYFQSVPFYNLPELNRILRPYFAEHGIENHGYGEILRDWILHNRAPHTDWDLA